MDPLSISASIVSLLSIAVKIRGYILSPNQQTSVDLQALNYEIISLIEKLELLASVYAQNSTDTSAACVVSNIESLHDEMNSIMLAANSISANRPVEPRNRSWKKITWGLTAKPEIDALLKRVNTVNVTIESMATIMTISATQNTVRDTMRIIEQTTEKVISTEPVNSGALPIVIDNIDEIAESSFLSHQDLGTTSSTEAHHHPESLTSLANSEVQFREQGSERIEEHKTWTKEIKPEQQVFENHHSFMLSHRHACDIDSDDNSSLRSRISWDTSNSCSDASSATSVSGASLFPSEAAKDAEEHVCRCLLENKTVIDIIAKAQRQWQSNDIKKLLKRSLCIFSMKLGDIQSPDISPSSLGDCRWFLSRNATGIATKLFNQWTTKDSSMKDNPMQDNSINSVPDGTALIKFLTSRQRTQTDYSNELRDNIEGSDDEEEWVEKYEMTKVAVEKMIALLSSREVQDLFTDAVKEKFLKPRTGTAAVGILNASKQTTSGEQPKIGGLQDCEKAQTSREGGFCSQISSSSPRYSTESLECPSPSEPRHKSWNMKGKGRAIDDISPSPPTIPPASRRQPTYILSDKLSAHANTKSQTFTSPTNAAECQTQDRLPEHHLNSSASDTMHMEGSSAITTSENPINQELEILPVTVLEPDHQPRLSSVNHRPMESENQNADGALDSVASDEPQPLPIVAIGSHHRLKIPIVCTTQIENESRDDGDALSSAASDESQPFKNSEVCQEAVLLTIQTPVHIEKQADGIEAETIENKLQPCCLRQGTWRRLSNTFQLQLEAIFKPIPIAWYPYSAPDRGLCIHAPSLSLQDVENQANTQTCCGTTQLTASIIHPVPSQSSSISTVGSPSGFLSPPTASLAASSSTSIQQLPNATPSRCVTANGSQDSGQYTLHICVQRVKFQSLGRTTMEYQHSEITCTKKITDCDLIQNLRKIWYENDTGPGWQTRFRCLNPWLLKSIRIATFNVDEYSSFSVLGPEESQCFFDVALSYPEIITRYQLPEHPKHQHEMNDTHTKLHDQFFMRERELLSKTRCSIVMKLPLMHTSHLASEQGIAYRECGILLTEGANFRAGMIYLLFWIFLSFGIATAIFFVKDELWESFGAITGTMIATPPVFLGALALRKYLTQ